VDYIRQAIDSVLMQKVNFSWELIIADDSSTDGTRNILQEYKTKYPDFITLILQEKNVGAYKNWIDLITYPQSKYIAYFEGDDYWTDPHKLQKQVDFMEANPDYAMVHTRYLFYIEKTKSFKQASLLKKSGDVFYDLLICNNIGTATVLMKKDYVTEAINANILHSDFLMSDYPLWLYFAQHHKIGYLDDCTTVYRILEESAARTKNPIKQFKFCQSIFDIRSFFGKKTEYYQIIQKKRRDFNLNSIINAFRNNQKDLGKVIYVSLKEHNPFSIKWLFFYWGTQNNLFGIVLKIVLFLKKKIKKSWIQVFGGL
jgi:glycosyltransferase involved in cell wall biosynthesis